VCGGAVRVYEGEWQPKRVVLFRFPSMQAIADTDLIAIEGV